MTTFQADKAFHFSEDGSKPWAVFELVPGSDAVYEFATDDPKVIARLTKADGVRKVPSPQADPKADEV